jgi:hypothetical protein
MKPVFIELAQIFLKIKSEIREEKKLHNQCFQMCIVLLTVKLLLYLEIAHYNLK